MAGPPKRVKPMVAKPPHVCEYCGRYAPTAGTCDGCGAPVVMRRVPPKPTPPPLTREQADPNARAELIGLAVLILGGWCMRWLLQ